MKLSFGNSGSYGQDFRGDFSGDFAPPRPKSHTSNVDGLPALFSKALPSTVAGIRANRGCYVAKTRSFFGGTLQLEEAFLADAKASVKDLKLPEKTKSGLPMNPFWATSAGVQYTLFLKMVRAMRSDVMKRRFRGHGRFRSKLMAKMAEAFETTITHSGGLHIKAARAGWAISVPDQETYDDWNGMNEVLGLKEHRVRRS